MVMNQINGESVCKKSGRESIFFVDHLQRSCVHVPQGISGGTWRTSDVHTHSGWSSSRTRFPISLTTVINSVSVYFDIKMEGYQVRSWSGGVKRKRRTLRMDVEGIVQSVVSLHLPDNTPLDTVYILIFYYFTKFTYLTIWYRRSNSM